jgi:hypothetical protein
MTRSGLTQGSIGRASVGLAFFRAPVSHNVEAEDLSVADMSAEEHFTIGCGPQMALHSLKILLAR